MQRPPGSSKRKRSARAAVTVDQLGGGASSRVDFIRTDARALKRSTPSNTHIKGALNSPFELPSGLTGLAAASVIRQLVASCSGGRTGQVPQGMVVGLGAVTRRLRRGELRAVVVAREMHPALLVAHVPVLSARREVPLCLLGCSSAQLGQPFGLLRAAAVGLDAAHFEAEHPLVRLLAESASATPPWLVRALSDAGAGGAGGSDAELGARPSAGADPGGRGDVVYCRETERY